jgi:hypothetical protein
VFLSSRLDDSSWFGNEPPPEDEPWFECDSSLESGSSFEDDSSFKRALSSEGKTKPASSSSTTLCEYRTQFVPSNGKERHCDSVRHCCSHAPRVKAVSPDALITNRLPPAYRPLKSHVEPAGGCSEGVQLSSVGG